MADLTSLVNFDRWSRACMDIGVAPDERDYRHVRRAWRGMGRHYHTLIHLDACLRELDPVRELAARPAEVEIALWFHDVIYRSWRRDNEEQSAKLAAQMLRAAPAETVERIRQMILDTRHLDEELGGDTALTADIDLSILGQPADVYGTFERAIRREYWWVPRTKYVPARSAVLERFLARSSIYQHDLFYQRYETQARTNLTAELARLTNRCA
jgi:predicted metal-dependent HD superfamily phosphohydrolase